LEFTNATVPLQGRITLDFGSTRQAYKVASVFPAEARAAGGSLVIIDFKNGKISDQGTVIGTTGENFLELTLYSGEKMKMNGWFYYYGTKGTMEFTK
jgi:hypothetical protein